MTLTNFFDGHPAYTQPGNSLGHPTIPMMRDALTLWLTQQRGPVALVSKVEDQLNHYIREVRDQESLSGFCQDASEHSLIQEGQLTLLPEALVSYANDEAGGAYVQTWLDVNPSDVNPDMANEDDAMILGHAISGRFFSLLQEVLPHTTEGDTVQLALQTASTAYQTATNTQRQLQGYRNVAADSRLLYEGTLELDDGALVDPDNHRVVVWLWIESDTDTDTDQDD